MPVDRARDYDVGMSPDYGRPEEIDLRDLPDLPALEDLEDWPDPEPPFATCTECGVFFCKDEIPKGASGRHCRACMDTIYGEDETLPCETRVSLPSG